MNEDENESVIESLERLIEADDEPTRNRLWKRLLDELTARAQRRWQIPPSDRDELVQTIAVGLLTNPRVTQKILQLTPAARRGYVLRMMQNKAVSMFRSYRHMMLSLERFSAERATEEMLQPSTENELLDREEEERRKRLYVALFDAFVCAYFQRRKAYREALTEAFVGWILQSYLGVSDAELLFVLGTAAPSAPPTELRRKTNALVKARSRMFEELRATGLLKAA